MLVQTMNAICLRFQNRRGPSERDPLANLEIDPLRPLNNIYLGLTSRTSPTGCPSPAELMNTTIITA